MSIAAPLSAPRRLVNWITARARVLMILLSLLVFAEAAALSLLSGNRLRFADETEYHVLAKNLAGGRGFRNEKGELTSYRPPGYPLLLTPLYAVVPRPLAGKLLNSALLGLASFLLARFAARRHALAGVLTPLLFLGYPLLAFTASTLYAQVAALFLLAVVMTALAGSDRVGPARAAGLGALWGLLILTVPSFILVSPLCVLLLLWQARPRFGAALPSALTFTALAVLPVGLWSARNHALHGQFVLISTNSGISLITGNSPHAGADTGVNVDLSAYRAEADKLGEVAQDRYFKDEAKRWMRENPGAAARLYAAKVVNYFNFRSRLKTAAESSLARDAVMFVSYYTLLGLVVLRLARIRRWPLDAGETAFALVYFGNAFLAALFFTRIRFRVPFDALLITLAALTLARLLSPARPPDDGRSGA